MSESQLAPTSVEVADGVAPGAPIDHLSAFSDMLAMNGGAPLRCLA